MPSFRNEAFSFFTHAAGAIAAVVGLILLLQRAPSGLAAAAFAIYGGTMAFMFTTSALHHVTHAEEGFFRKLDMTAIYLFIAGTYTPFCVLAVPLAWGLPLLLVVWALAVAGIVMRWTMPSRPRWMSASLYLGLGWLGVLGFWPLAQHYGWGSVLLVALGGVVYSVGAIVYARGRPDPLPQYVGHHGLWHVCVLVAAAIHFGLVWGLA
jgi:hemolysin III